MKYILLLLACLLTLGAQAQQPTVPGGAGSYNGKVMDTTIANAGTPSVVIPVKGDKNAVAFQYVITKNSGTVAGSIALQGSLDGGTTWAAINTYTLTDATASTSLSYAFNAYPKYRVLVTTTGTQNSNHKIWVLYRD